MSQARTSEDHPRTHSTRQPAALVRNESTDWMTPKTMTSPHSLPGARTVASTLTLSGDSPDVSLDDIFLDSANWSDCSQDEIYAVHEGELTVVRVLRSIGDIMNTALPRDALISREAKICMQECLSEFISFITSEAAENCQQEHRDCVEGEDVIFALTSLGFENYGEALTIYLVRYREDEEIKMGMSLAETQESRVRVWLRHGSG